MSFNKWEHLFLKGEYPSREKLLSGLTLEQINAVPKGIPHSIYEEFWHLVAWQDIAGSNDEGNYLKWEKGERFPEEKPTDLRQWEDLVNNFNDRVRKILDYCSTPENLAIEAEPGLTIGDALNCLAVHNAVHFGKILAIRQAIGAWPPEEKINKIKTFES